MPPFHRPRVSESSKAMGKPGPIGRHPSPRGNQVWAWPRSVRDTACILGEDRPIHLGHVLLRLRPRARADSVSPPHLLCPPCTQCIPCTQKAIHVVSNPALLGPLISPGGPSSGQASDGDMSFWPLESLGVGTEALGTSLGAAGRDKWTLPH